MGNTPGAVKRAVAAVGFGLLLACVAACRTQPIRDVIDAPLPSVWSEASPDAADEAIWRAGRKVGWQIERLRPGVLRGTWRHEHYTAVVTITREGDRLGIRYEESDHLLREGGIHSNYNAMVERLLRQIEREPVLDLEAAAPADH
jgi:hypothetical protein